MNNLPRQKLCEIIAKYGQSLCDEPRRCEGLLRDFCGEHKREINVLVGALRERVAIDLISSPANIPSEVLLARLTKRLQDDLALSEDAARWAVESWALALEVISSAECETGIPKPEAPLSKSGVAEPSGRSKIRWYTYLSSYVSELVGRLASDMALINGAQVLGVDGRELLEQGCMSGTRMYSGKLVACADTVSLLGCGRIDLLKQWLESKPVSQDEPQSIYTLRLYYVEGNVTKARYELDKWQENEDFDVSPSILLAVEYGETELAKQWLKEAEAQARGSSAWTSCARGWNKVFNDEAEARRCLNEAKDQAEDSSDWTSCAEAWKEVFDDDGEALRCLKKAEAQAEAFYDWKQCAEGWKEVFDDDALKASGGKPGSCWACRNGLRFPPRIRIEKHIVMLNHDTQLFPHHIDAQKMYDFSQPIAEVTKHPKEPSIWGIKNLSDEKWVNTTANGTIKDVEPGRNVTLAVGTKINFGKTEGEIRV